MLNGKRVIEFIIKGKDDTSGAFGSLSGRLKQLATSTVGIGVAFAAVGVAVKKMATAIRGALAGASRDAGEFQKSIYEVNTLMNSDAAAVSKMGKQLQALSAEFGQLDTVMAKAQYNVVSAGFGDVADSMHILEVASKAAIGGVSDVNTAAKVITQTLNAYGKSASDAEAVAGTLFATVKGGVTTFEELAGYLGKVTASAAVAGISFEEVSAAMAVMTKNGINTAESATALNSLIIALGAASGESKQKLDELGINLDNGLAPALTAVDKAGGSSLAMLREMVPNTRALKAAASAGADGAKAMTEQLALMSDGVKNFNDAYAIMTQTLDMANKRLAASKKRLSDAVGAAIIEGQTDAIGAQAEAYNKLAVSAEENLTNTKALFDAMGELTALTIRLTTANDGLLIKIVDIAIATNPLARAITDAAAAVRIVSRWFDDGSESIAEYTGMVERATGQLGPFTREMVSLNGLEAGLGPFVRSAAEQGADAAAATLEAFAAEWGVRTTDSVLDPKTLKWLDVQRSAVDIAKDISAAYAEAMKLVVPPAPVLQKELGAPDMDDGEPQIQLLEDIMAAEKLRAEQLTTYYGSGDIEAMNGMVSPERMKEIDEGLKEFLASQARMAEQQQALRDAVKETGANFERLASNSISAFLKGTAGAMKFGTMLRTIVLDALSAVIAKLLAIQAIKLGTKIFGLEHGGTVPEFAFGGSVPRAAHGYAVPDGPRGMDSRLIAAMPGEEVIKRSLSQRLDRFLVTSEQAAIVSPFDLGSGGGGGGASVVLNVARPVSYLDALDLGEHATTAARKFAEARL